MTPMLAGFMRGVRSRVTGHEYAETLPAVNERRFARGSVAEDGLCAVANGHRERTRATGGQRVARVGVAARRALGRVQLSIREIADHRDHRLEIAPREGVRAQAVRRIGVVAVEALDVRHGEWPTGPGEQLLEARPASQGILGRR